MRYTKEDVYYKVTCGNGSAIFKYGTYVDVCLKHWQLKHYKNCRGDEDTCWVEYLNFEHCNDKVKIKRLTKKEAFIELL